MRVLPHLFYKRGKFLSLLTSQPKENPLPVHRQAVQTNCLLTVAPEQQPQGVQVVERVGLVAFSFQFFPRLAAVFAEEVGDFYFGYVVIDCHI